ncbi:hypothetical protein PM082_019721 [Marasmius tenuissimus]|nr:hypothetical protein PM082_019721 [Marasmius tenuissimus]
MADLENSDDTDWYARSGTDDGPGDTVTFPSTLSVVDTTENWEVTTRTHLGSSTASYLAEFLGLETDNTANRSSQRDTSAEYEMMDPGRPTNADRWDFLIVEDS